MPSGDLVGLIFGTALLVILVIGLAFRFNRAAAGVIVAGLAFLAAALYDGSAVPEPWRLWLSVSMIGICVGWTLWSMGTRLSAAVKEGEEAEEYRRGAGTTNTRH